MIQRRQGYEIRRRIRIIAVVVFFVAVVINVFLIGDLHAGDWPHRRGPDLSGRASDEYLIDAWPEEGPPVLWTKSMGDGYSAMAVVGDRVFVQTQSMTSQNVECWDANSGQLRWRTRYAWPYQTHGLYPGPRSTPFWNNDSLYIVGPGGEFQCLNAASGTTRWKTNLLERFNAKKPIFGYGASPTIWNDRLLLPVGGEESGVVALEPSTGDTAWTAGSEKASYCSILPIEFEDRTLAVALLQNMLQLIEIETGRILDVLTLSSGYDEHAAAPLYQEPYLVVASPFRAGAQCYEIRNEVGNDEGVELHPLWINSDFSNDTASSVIEGGAIYGFDIQDVQAKVQRPSRGTYKCLDLVTGDVRWQTDQVGHATTIVADGKLILFTDDGELILARADPDRYVELARIKVFHDEICWTTPTLSDGRLYLRSPGRAVCLFLGEGALPESSLSSVSTIADIPQTHRFNLHEFMGGERTYMMDAASLEELLVWYVYSVLGVLIPFSILYDLSRCLKKRFWPSVQSKEDCGDFPGGLYWSVLILAAFLAPAAYNRLGDAFVFTWPLALAVSHQMVLAASARRCGRLQGTAFLLAFGFVCFLYFLGCHRLGMANQWVFLMAFMPSWPVTVPAAFRLRRPISSIKQCLVMFFSFTAFYWSTALIIFFRRS
jgi:outer membrane protein assembly factor BamB